ncbi:class II glutamine amidotransferase [Chitinivibrio alkaliphilus]|uniref:Glutamine amidotransferase class-ii n=1 Tax=Chitinivibrio alkaliphilus ACht1 TaxID=1313304 RepID=U7D699_9BACT|nr:class II glutamine amidotransferase [Chitinivibrio alkaliphilus]ERP31463.1 glutamine amidotransferase class-ii [Chitinivibrio alkaliphilus ACht1]
MCQLLGMSANTPTDIRFSFSGLRVRGGERGPHRDGYGLCLYRQRGVQAFHDFLPASQSDLAVLLERLPIKADVALGHIRQANVGVVSLVNTHPFIREWRGRYWSFAHNGQFRGSKGLPQTYYTPVGTTDSEAGFCWIMNQLRALARPPGEKRLCTLLHQFFQDLDTRGIFNAMLTDGDRFFTYCSKSLYWITRRAPFGQAKLVDRDMMVDFSRETTPRDVVTLIATEPLTEDEAWTAMQPGELILWKNGEIVWRGV